MRDFTHHLPSITRTPIQNSPVKNAQWRANPVRESRILGVGLHGITNRIAPTRYRDAPTNSPNPPASRPDHASPGFPNNTANARRNPPRAGYASPRTAAAISRAPAAPHGLASADRPATRAKPRLDQPPAGRVIGVTLGQGPKGVQVIGQHHPGFDPERPFVLRRPHRLAQGGDLIDQEPRPSIRQSDGEEDGRTGGAGARGRR